MELTGRVALVSGGGTGLGREISNLLVSRGASLAITYSRSREEAEAAVAELGRVGPDVTLHQVDVSVGAQVDALVAEVTARHGGIDYLVNCAGTTAHVPFKDLAALTDDIWDRLLGVNLKGPFYCCRAAAESMRVRGGGSIVNITSTSAMRPVGSSIAYSVSKAAEMHLTRCLAAALAPEIRVNAVAPGGMWTRWWSGRMTEEQQRERAQESPLRRWADLGDVAAMTLALLTNESMTGQTVILDGGLVMP